LFTEITSYSKGVIFFYLHPKRISYCGSLMGKRSDVWEEYFYDMDLRIFGLGAYKNVANYINISYTAEHDIVGK
jgi:hypothetical protein